MVSFIESSCSALASGGGELVPSMCSASSSSPVRPLLLRSDIAWAPEDDVLPGGSAGAVESRDLSLSDVGGSASPPVEERLYELPPSVAGRLAFGEALSAAHCRRRSKRRREDESAELDDAAEGVAGSGPAPPCGDEDDKGDDEGASGGGSLST